MKEIYQNTVDGANTVIWFNDDDFEYSAVVGDCVNIKFTGEQKLDIKEARIVDILKDFIVVETDEHNVLCFYDDITDMEVTHTKHENQTTNEQGSTKSAPPCSDCPFRLGKVKFFVSPCPDCTADNNYEMYRSMKRDLERKD